MRKLKQISLSVVLMLTLGTGAMAGIIETPPAPPPPPAESVTATGISECPPSAQPADDNNPVIDLALAVLLTLF